MLRRVAMAAPVGLALTISTTAALTGTTLATTIATQTTATTMNWLNLKSISAIVAGVHAGRISADVCIYLSSRTCAATRLGRAVITYEWPGFDSRSVPK